MLDVVEKPNIKFIIKKYVFGKVLQGINDDEKEVIFEKKQTF